MIDNGLVFAVQKSIARERNNQEKVSKARQALGVTLKKHNVTLDEQFSTLNWSKVDQKTFIKGMILSGYEHLIGYYQ